MQQSATVTRLMPAADTSPAEWVVTGLRGFAESVLSLVPGPFPAYLRVFHPAYRCTSGESKRVRWAEIAAANGKPAHPGMQLDVLTGSTERPTHRQPGVFDRGPEGSLPLDEAVLLAKVLANHTTTPNDCWFAVWEGWGDIRSDIASAPTFKVPARAHHLLSGPIEAASESVEQHRMQSASLWWPDDHAWCVSTEIDFDTTYVGCDESCCQEILRLPDIEALVIDPAGRGYEGW